jgi:hypothetical protein
MRPVDDKCQHLAATTVQKHDAHEDWSATLAPSLIKLGVTLTPAPTRQAGPCAGRAGGSGSVKCSELGVEVLGEGADPCVAKYRPHMHTVSLSTDTEDLRAVRQQMKHRHQRLRVTRIGKWR